VEKLLKLYNAVAGNKNAGFRFEVYHSDAMDWCITIYSKDGERITDITNSEMKPAFSKAYNDLKNWLEENGEYKNG